MNYDKIDEILRPWLEKNNIQLFTMDRDWEIRSFTANKTKYLILASEDNEIILKSFNASSKSLLKEETVNVNELKSFLEKIDL